MEKQRYYSPDCEVLHLELQSGLMDASNGNEEYDMEHFDPEFDD